MSDPTPPDDDEALRWDGDDEARPTLPAGWHAKGRGADLVETEGEPAAGELTSTAADTTAFDATTSDTAAADTAATGQTEATASGEPAPAGNAALIALGMLGGVYLLFTIGWVVGGLRLQPVAVRGLLVSPAAYIPAFVLAVLAPALWFVVTLVLTRRRAAWARFVWLAAGVLLLVPWPFVMVGAVGQ
ncbi:hypothetical protein [Microbacterium luticocti]|uniref:hypothetical protein n=1 Tax=Microbacterium luticocti TaxID=451764 RepID=UPI000427E0B4|nr:hypothetical protein [Microbacterium luticocti]